MTKPCKRSHWNFTSIESDRYASELSSNTLAALQEFYLETELKEKRFEDLKTDVEEKSLQAQLSMDMFSENWNASQFWVNFYSIYAWASFSCA